MMQVRINYKDFTLKCWKSIIYLQSKNIFKEINHFPFITVQLSWGWKTQVKSFSSIFEKYPYLYAKSLYTLYSGKIAKKYFNEIISVELLELFK